MKTLRKLFNVVAMLAVAMFAFAACTIDDTRDESVFVPFDIDFSTGEAEWDSTNQSEELVLNKLGVGTTGTVPYLEVNSSVYWTVSVEYDQTAIVDPETGESTPIEPWLEVSPLGGPQPATAVTNVYLTMGENSGEDRTATVVFKTMETKYTVRVRQRGPKTNVNESRLVFVQDNFGGDMVKENTAVKFYTFANADGSKSYNGVATAGDLYAYAYAGSDNVYASVDEPSKGYNDVLFDLTASGGANIMIDGAGHFDIRNFNNQDKTDFYLSFGAKNSDGKFDKSKFKLYISHDNANWAEMDYTHTTHPTNDWSLNTFDFSIAPNVSKILYFRFENTSDDVYRIDDIFFSEYDPSDNIFPLIELGSDIIGLPVNFKFNDLKQGETKGDNWAAFGVVLSEESGAYEKEEPVEFSTALTTSANVQFIMGTEASIVKERAGNDGLSIASSAPRAVGMYEGDYWIWTLPVHNAAANTNIACQFAFHANDAGGKYHIFEWAQCTADEYKLGGRPLIMIDDVEKDAFYDSLDWTQWNLVTVDVPNDVDVGKSASGIPIGNASSPAGYWSGSITYSDTFKGAKGSTVITTDPDKVIINFPDAMEDGYYFLRLRLVSNLTAGPCNSTNYQRMNKVDHNGTNYLRNTAQFRFAGCGQVVDSSDGYKLLSIVNDFGAQQYYTGGDLYYSNNAVMGVYAGSTNNLRATTAGNNQFVGTNPNTGDTGKAVYVYSPYDASNDAAAGDITLSVPTAQRLTDDALVLDSTPLIMTNEQTYRTTRMMRCDMKIMSSVLQLGIYSKTKMNDKISKVILRGENIAGSHTVNLYSRQDAGELNPLSALEAVADKAIIIPDNEYDAANVYMGVWGAEQRTITAEIYAGAYYYTVELPAADYVVGNVTKHLVCLDDCTKTLAPDVVTTGIDSGATFLQFVSDLAAGKSGEEMAKYRNLDGDYGFVATEANGGAIDMGGINMETWPDVKLNENFNGGGVPIKNLVINTPNRSLFRNLLYGNTITNVVLDESCRLNVTLSEYTGEAQSWAYLVNSGVVTEDAKLHEATGNIENCTSYGQINITGEHSNDNIYIGAFVGQASGANSDLDAPSRMAGCKNYGTIRLYNITQGNVPLGTESQVSHAYYRYTTVGGFIGRAAGYEVTGCNNYGEIVMESNVNRHFGTFYIGAIAGYATNRVDTNITNLFGNINNCTNYGNLTVGAAGAPVTVHTFALSGGVGRTQWANLTRLTNEGDINVYAIHYDPFITGEYTYKDSWASEIAGTTNAIDYFCVGGLLCFTQCNIAVGCENTFLINSGDIYVECDTSATQLEEGSMRYADNCGICVGGSVASAGANAYNPHYNSCSNMGNVTLKCNKASAEAFLGGVMGKMASNRYTADYVFYLNGSSNVGTVSFLTDNPETVIAHVGGVCGSMIYGELKADINGGAVSSQSTHPESTIGAILGTQHASSIGTACTLEHALVLEAAAVGGSVNGVVLNEQNFSEYVYGGSQSKEVYLKDNAYFNYVP
ncbi:MAG: BACON domain-containing protein [Alistipes sp.]|nr:BACON domain-containing protein [Alistipes sp.]